MLKPAQFKRFLILIVVTSFFNLFYVQASNGALFLFGNDALLNESILAQVDEKYTDSILDLRNVIKKYIDSSNAELAVYHSENYIRETGDFSIINDHFFHNVSETDIYLNFKKRYQLEFDFITLFYFFTGFLGLFIFLLLNLKKRIQKSSAFLMSVFVLLHSLFILHLGLYLTNSHFYFPNTLLISTTFTLLYGPIIYFYFKITVSGYKLRFIDILHIIPALFLLLLILPIYRLSTHEKFVILFDGEEVVSGGLKYFVFIKIASLLIYAWFSLKLYNSYRSKENNDSRYLIWQRNILAIFALYVITFILFTATTYGYFDSPTFYHMQILAMMGLVFYVAYITYVQPEILKGEVTLVDPINLFKYKTSSLTESYSLELKDTLVELMTNDRVYRENDISLQGLSEKLGTSRHNTSQVINEHFNSNFFELINKYRIEDAAEILKNNNENLTIIEVAYKVGFNNKVTFNKSFKKYLLQTPSQYIRSFRK